ncbi:MAG TPA: hypothetical protein VJT83_05400, partial [Chitinophagaceae bacterium]|nr:hypothetical protein [Chitinophagaceae bacterium]
MKFVFGFLSSLTSLTPLTPLLVGCSNAENKYSNWSNYGGTKEMSRYSSLTQIDTNNVTQLQIAWIYNT